MKRLSIGRSKVFELWKSGELKSIMIGGRRFSTDRQIEEYLSRLEQFAETIAGPERGLMMHRPQEQHADLTPGRR
jgi:hypothetical protein